MKKDAESSSTSTSKKQDGRKDNGRHLWIGRPRFEKTKRCELFEFVYECRECGLVMKIYDYTRPERRICGKCNLPMRMERRAG